MENRYIYLEIRYKTETNDVIKRYLEEWTAEFEWDFNFSQGRRYSFFGLQLLYLVTFHSISEANNFIIGVQYALAQTRNASRHLFTLEGKDEGSYSPEPECDGYKVQARSFGKLYCCCRPVEEIK